MRRHTKSLIRILQNEAPSVLSGAEVGVWKAENAVNLLRRFPDLFLYLIDQYEPVLEAMRRKTSEDFDQALQTARTAIMPFYGRCKLLLMESGTAASHVLNGSLDFAFVDASHTYHAVKRDLTIWWERLCNDGGLLVGHDYNGIGDRKGVFGVKRAVDEFAVEKARIVHTAPGLIWWIRK